MQFVYVEPGSFQMGLNAGNSNEKLVHQVTISKGYWIGKYEVTQNEYKLLMGNNPSTFKGVNNPVEQVSWDDAVSFCKKFTEQERVAGRLPSEYEYRLPTEAEWEFAARGGNASKGYKYSGGDNLDSVAWYYENSGNSRISESSWKIETLKSNSCQTHEVGTKSANESGIYDMSGNVWEWCHDWYMYGEYAGKNKADPARVAPGSGRVVRGGSWEDTACGCLVTIRRSSSPSRSGDDIGFRVAIALSPK
jgi:formylglycine-generating enzyme required for sulfatase activity